MLNKMLPIVGIMKINQYQKCIKKCMDIKWFNGLKYIKTYSISYETCWNLGHQNNLQSWWVGQKL